MFDRAWSIVCRDAAKPVGQLYAFRNGANDPLTMVGAQRGTEIRCGAESQGKVEGLGDVAISECSYTSANVGYRTYRYRTGKFTYFAQGLAGYDSALTLGLRSIVADRIVPGQVSVATTGIDDPVAFARVQAGALDPAQTLAEGYRRNNSGNYAEAAEFFDTLQQNIDDKDTPGANAATRAQRLNEYVVNRGLQKSNLGQFAEADPLFAEADAIPTLDKVQTRLRRNYEALHLLNQQQFDTAIAVLDRPVVSLADVSIASGNAVELGPQVSAEINSGLNTARGLGATQRNALTPEERAAILDAQALQLRGTIARLQGRPAEARGLLQRALADAMVIRDGRVTSITRLRAQIMAETALAYEDEGDFASAEGLLRGALDLLATNYPETTAMNGARARLAAYLVRRGQRDAALGLYREVVLSATENRSSTTGLTNQLAPYFSLLSGLIPTRPALTDDMFLATQTLVRPGVSDTQAILSRELRQGDSEASRLFRQAITLGRDIERGRIELARLKLIENPDAGIAQMIAAQQADIETLVSEQAITQASLSGYAQYRALSTDAMTLADLRAALKPGEAYYKLAVVGRSVYAVYADGAGATAYQLPITTDQMAEKVAALRDSISKDEGGQLVTYPFDVTLARALYLDLFAPVADRVAATDHLIFEPDGAMLALPPNLLIASQAGVDRYVARTADENADAFDMREIDWLGRNHAISTAVSARSFRDARQTRASAAKREYIGFGQNAPATQAAVFASSNRAVSGDGAVDCNWPLTEWNKPISAVELQQTVSRIGADPSAIVTGRAFSDSAIRTRSDLNDFRILHFATHGLVTAPRPECPARPALLTSFGDTDSDGLLSFSEIYDLKIDADLVILSACDTAGQASAEATRAAGITTGGGSALDGLVRAFIGAGGRSVVASHWPAPDDFNATQRLISGLFEGGSTTDIAQAMRQSEVRLMDEAQTSHPYYWSGFAIVGDGARQLLTAAR
nr:CHAT domain-containing tetratricopeptide repeat protein [Sphingobium boeckii]